MTKINRLSINNFKSIKNIDIDCMKLNIFIGEPNSGKSNILEALGLATWIYKNNKSLHNYVRGNQIYEFFKDHIVDKSISINLNNTKIKVKNIGEEFTFSVDGENRITRSNDGSGTRSGNWKESNFYKIGSKLNFYRFNKNEKHDNKQLGSMLSPHGQNLFRLIISRQDIQDRIRDIVSEFGLKLSVNSNENKFEAVRDRKGILINYSYSILSDTVRAFIFYTTVLLSNKNSIIMLEEPEEKNYPHYADRLAEMIAEDATNQFFIVTHNPYFLDTLLNKSKKVDIAIYYVYMKNFDTNVRLLSDEDLYRLRQGDIFYNLQHLNE